MTIAFPSVPDGQTDGERYSGTIRDQFQRPIAGALVAVTISDTGDTATIYDDNGDALENPFIVGELGDFAFTVQSPGLYELGYFYGGRNVYTETVPIGAGNLPSDIVITLGQSNGAGLVGFSDAENYASGTVGASLQSRAVSITDPPYNADSSGLSNSSAAFNAAIMDGARAIRVPKGTYRLDTVVNRDFSIYWDIDPEALFNGAGVATGNFPYAGSNPTNLPVGPFIQSRSSQKAIDSNGGIAAFTVDMVQPNDYGAGQSVAAYIGNVSANPDPLGNNWAINCLTHAVGNAGGVYQSIEADANNDSPFATVKGIAITGGGTQDCAVGLEVVRLAGSKWEIGAYFANVGDGIVVRPDAGGRGLVMGLVGSDPAPQVNTPASVRQFINGGDTIFLQRLTDTAPTGQFLRFTNAANSQNIVVLDVAGNLSLRAVTATDRVQMNTATLTGYALLNYADDAAAAANGVPLGGIYHNAGSARIRIA